MDFEAVELFKKLMSYHLYLYLSLCFLVFVFNLIRGAAIVNCEAVELCKKLTSHHLYLYLYLCFLYLYLYLI